MSKNWFIFTSTPWIQHALSNYLFISMYVSRDVPIAKSIWTQGIPQVKVTSFVGNWAKMTPAPRTSSTVLVATIAELCDRDAKQRTTFPLAKVAFRVPETQLLLKVTAIRI